MGSSHLLNKGLPLGPERGCGGPDVPHHHSHQGGPGEVQSPPHHRPDWQWF
uniref:C-terminal binding protein 1 isoform E n=1 Tax=Homo sapiens TaxID=9606 RepID=X5D315_HUMAN|nr:C-terminal binding protein 1 isoform E [Homo sapiens]